MIESFRAQIVNLINAERIKAGVGNLIIRQDILDASNTRAKESADLWSHTRPDGSPYYTANNEIYGENLSKNWRSPKEIVDAWMRSDTHRAVMLDKRYKGVNVGVYNKNEKETFVSLELTL